MRAYLKTIATFLSGAMLLSAAHAGNDVRILYKEPLQQMHAVLATSVGTQHGGAESVRALHFDAFGKRFALTLETNRAILSPTLRARLDQRYGVYRGAIAGAPNSWVRLVVEGGLPRGMLWDGAEFLAIDVAFNAVTGSNEAFIYRLKDLQIPAGALSCGEISTAGSAAELAEIVVSEFVGAQIGRSAAPAGGPTSQIDLAVIGDFEFTDSAGSGAVAALTERINNVDGIFSTQLGVRINVNRIDTYATNNDPFSDVSDAGSLLDELADYRGVTPEQRANGLTHLFTGRDLDDSTVGIAYTSAICSPGYGVGLTQGSTDVVLDSLIAAHEVGHNFGAIHDGADAPCENVPETFLMAPQLNGSSEFSSCSITSMQEEVSQASCITEVPTTDVAVFAGVEAAAVLLGDSEILTFEANNVGSNDAAGVTVDVTIPSGLALESVTATAGSCSSGAGSVSCGVGNIAVGSGATVSIGVAAASVGSFEFAASIVADDDSDLSNNAAATELTVNPAVDLVATAGAPAQVGVNASVTVNATLENRAAIAATGVTLTVSPQSGLSVDSASWSAGTCSIAGNVATCRADSLAPQSSTELQLTMTGTSAGGRTYRIAASSAEADRAPSNNDASGQVTVQGPPDSGSDSSGKSGGGSLGWLSLLLLILPPILRRKRQTGTFLN